MPYLASGESLSAGCLSFEPHIQPSSTGGIYPSSSHLEDPFFPHERGSGIVFCLSGYWRRTQG